MNDEARFEPAEQGDLARLSEIAFAAKAYWQYPTEWLERWRPQLTITDDDLASGAAFKLTESGEIRGFYTLRKDGEKLWLEHLWLDPSSIGNGLGRRLFEHAMVTAEGMGYSTVFIESDPNAEGFYAAMGAVKVGEVNYQMDDGVRTLPFMEVQL